MSFLYVTAMRTRAQLCVCVRGVVIVRTIVCLIVPRHQLAEKERCYVNKQTRAQASSHRRQPEKDRCFEHGSCFEDEMHRTLVNVCLIAEHTY